ncbi:MAG: ABC transporter permease, partial [Prolixibacteraceae bacterium]
RPVPKLEETAELLRRSELADNGVFLAGFNSTVQYRGSTSENTEVLATTHGLLDLWNLELDRGRYFTEEESRSGAPMALVGSELVKRLFEGSNPLGKEIKVHGYRMIVIGVYKQKGEDMFGTSMDKRIHITVPFAVQMVDFRNRDMGQTINVKARPGADKEHFKAELEGIMRSIRRLKPMEENNFAVNEISVISSSLDTFFAVFNIAGSVIGGFSILVGGFGIANIMFVSVKERTRIIGIQKSLGAKRYFILMEFIFESVILSVLGGVVGLLLVFTGTSIVSAVSEMTLALSIGNIVLGLFVSAIIGLLAGFLPALTAARLDPVTAMNTV